MAKKVLMVVTNHATITDDHKTGLWLEEFAAPHSVFKEQGYDITVRSISGGEVPLDPNSVESEDDWKEAQDLLKDTKKLSKDEAEGYDAVFLPGGHGTMFDFPDSNDLKYVLQTFAEDRRVIGSVCHGPAGLVNVMYRNGVSIVDGKTVTAFTDDEEKEMQLDSYMPFMLETTLKQRGAIFERGDNWADFAVRDGYLVTGQNPQSSKSAAQKVIEALEE
ncbi:type 1 glutamine amidotransferase domain-containing protein [Halalkalibacillus halophilus]|uniref:type 1 glutamine amidotransferase domain-containing protein n=1 Tax=Halalkalibacillus halophilus TaxID=392827 RepID=UPI000420F09D|nr:type 1 glutamine amidotransferase domain-containing protein [Halalkalibacillus halophilus]